MAAGAHLADIVGFDKKGDEVVEVSNCGSVFLYEQTDETWCLTQTINSNNPVDDDRFGYALAMDGDTIVVGAPRVDVDGDLFAGAAEIFTRVGGTWVYTATLPGGGLGNAARFGSAVAIDGEQAIGNGLEEGLRAIVEFAQLVALLLFAAHQLLQPSGEPDILDLSGDLARQRKEHIEIIDAKQTARSAQGHNLVE